MLKELGKIKNEIINIFWPRTCLGCGREGQYICKNCEIFLSEVDPGVGHAMSNWTSHVQLPTKVGLDVVSVWEYEGIVEKAILKIKYDGCHDIIDELLTRALEKIELNLPEGSVITYVPMWQKKEKARGYNQAELIAQALGKNVEHSVSHMLEKIRDTKSQTELGPKERLENVKGAFSLLTLSVNQLVDTECQQDVPENVLLVDDVYTTGATMAECAKALKEAGVKNVWGFTLARTMSIRSC